MDAFCRKPNRTAPEAVAEGGRRRADVPLCSRTNGWSWPPHPFQLLAWLLYLYFAVTSLGVFVPLLPPHWVPAGYICTGVTFLSHLCVHVTAVSIDPADYNVRSRSHRGPVPLFDRSKHPHVIENCHCFLCQVDVGAKSKHCSSCNKCVANFDHHCRWLNNCVGSRNYRLFLHSVLSALLGVGLVLLVSSYVFVEFFLDPASLRSNQHFLARNDSSAWFVFLPVAPLRSAAPVIPGLAAVTIALALLSSVLLSHLLCFHLYLMWNRLSTYEYIVRQRHRHGRSDARTPAAPSADLFQDGRPRSSQAFGRPQLDQGGGASVPGQPGSRAGSGDTSPAQGGTEASPEPSAAAPPRRPSQKKKRRRPKVPAEGAGAPVPAVAPPPAEPSSTSSLSLAPRVPFPAFPLRAPLAPPGPPQPAGPPAEYHSDSAESLEEMPVVLARLGSSLRTFAPQSPHPRTKREAPPPHADRSAGEPFEPPCARPPAPAVFVSRASGEPALSLLVEHRRTGFL